MTKCTHNVAYLYLEWISTPVRAIFNLNDKRNEDVISVHFS